MKQFFYSLLFASISLSGCMNVGNDSTEEANPADTIYLGDLREKFKGDSLFFNVVAPDLVLVQNQYTWVTTVSMAQKKGLSEAYYEKVKEEISKTNEAIRNGIKKGADESRIPDFQKLEQ